MLTEYKENTELILNSSNDVKLISENLNLRTDNLSLVLAVQKLQTELIKSDEKLLNFENNMKNSKMYKILSFFNKKLFLTEF